MSWLVIGLGCMVLAACNSGSDAETVAGELEDRLTELLDFEGGSVASGEAPEGSDSAEAPQIETVDAPARLVFDVPFTVRLTTRYADPAAVKRALVRVEGATRHLVVTAPLVEVSGSWTMTLRGLLREDPVLSGADFRLSYALQTGDGLTGSYAQRNLAIQELGKSLSCEPDPCNTHGSCNLAGDLCTCDTGYSGYFCDDCAAGYTAYPDCALSFCTPDPCNAHGLCDPTDGRCTCDLGYAGDFCDDCAAGYSGYPDCTANVEPPGLCPVALDEYGLCWIEIPPGNFEMGCVPQDMECVDDSKPRHTVTLDLFWMTATEITLDQYNALTEGEHPSNFASCTGDCPVESVTWAQAKAFCEKVGGELPSESQWEYAARGGKETIYICGDDPVCLDEVAWHPDISEGTTHPVGTKTANSFGLYDMQGNVCEWTADCWNTSYDGAPEDGSPWAEEVPCPRVVRGGSWGTFYEFDGPLSISCRYGEEESTDRNHIGFRCIRRQAEAS